MNNQRMNKLPLFQLLSCFLLFFSSTLHAQTTDLHVVAQADSLNCHSDDDGELFWEVSGGFPPYSYEWQRLNNGFVFASGVQESSGLAGPVGGNLEANFYIITILDAAGHEVRDTVEIGEPARILVTDITLDNASCHDSCDGSIQMMIEGGTGALTTEWNDGPDLGPNREGLCAGEYVFFILDERACRQKGSIGINAPAPLEVEAITTSPSCAGAANGEVRITTASGGTGELDFNWSSGQSGMELQHITSGQYELTITDERACQLVATIDLLDGPPLEANVQVNYGCGEGQLIVSTQPINGTPPYVYDWSTGSTAPWLFQMSSGTYSLSLADADGCRDDVTFILDFVPPLTVLEEVQTVSCPGSADGTVTLAIEGGLPPYLVRWDDQTTEMERLGLSGGAYDYNVSAGGCAVAGVAFVEEPPAWQADFIFTPQNNQLLTATALITGGSFPYVYQWSSGSSGTSATNLNPELTYTLLVTDGNNCQQEWEVNPALTAARTLAAESAVTVYPNPSRGLFNLYAHQHLNAFNAYTVYAADGKLVQRGEVLPMEEASIDLTGLPQGLYRLKLTGKSEPVFISLIKQ